MKRSRRAGMMVIAAAAAVLTAGQVQAQYRVGDDGRALDANNRVGSGGFNHTPFGGNDSLLPGARPIGSAAVTGNQIVTGNVTGGKAFRGNVPYTDPRDFRGNVAGSQTDTFIAGSSGAQSAYTMPGAPLTVATEAFYGQRMATPPPTGFTERGFTGVYTPAPQPSQRQISEQFLRLGAPADSRLLTPGIYTMPGQVDAVTGLPLMLAQPSSLGPTSLTTGVGDLSFLAGNNTSSTLSRLRIDPTQVLQMQQELLSSPLRASAPATGAKLPAPKTGEGETGTTPGASSNLLRPMASPFEAPETQNIGAQAMVGGDLTAKPLGAQGTSAGMSSRLLAPPSQQSTQYAELEKRLSRYNDRLKTDEDRNRELIQQMKAREAAEAAKKATTPTPTVPQPETPTPPQPGTSITPGGTGLTPGGARPGSTVIPPKTGTGAGRTPAAGETGGLLPDYAAMNRQLLGGAGPGATGEVKPGAGMPQRPEPMRITSLAQGIKAEGLAKVMTDAETMMKQGKYISAVEQYEAAANVAPNNSLVRVGAVNAELGAGFYKRAAGDLRRTLQADPVLTMAQFDLKGMMGQERLETVIKSLKEAARQQANDPDPVLLLAYVAYNTGNEGQAGSYLDLAQKRAGGKDEFYRMLKTNWAVPAGAPTTQPANK